MSGTSNKIHEFCKWCGEDLGHFQRREFEGKFVNCPCCSNQYLVEDDDYYYYSYLLRPAVKGVLVSSIGIKRARIKKETFEVECIENLYNNTNFTLGRRYVVEGRKLSCNLLPLSIDESGCGGNDFEFALCKFRRVD